MDCIEEICFHHCNLPNLWWCPQLNHETFIIIELGCGNNYKSWIYIGVKHDSSKFVCSMHQCNSSLIVASFIPPSISSSLFDHLSQSWRVRPDTNMGQRDLWICCPFWPAATCMLKFVRRVRLQMLCQFMIRYFCRLIDILTSWRDGCVRFVSFGWVGYQLELKSVGSRVLDLDFTSWAVFTRKHNVDNEWINN